MFRRLGERVIVGVLVTLVVGAFYALTEGAR